MFYKHSLVFYGVQEFFILCNFCFIIIRKREGINVKFLLHVNRITQYLSECVSDVVPFKIFINPVADDCRLSHWQVDIRNWKSGFVF